MTEKDKFDAAMDRLLKANPAVVKAAMEQEKKERAEERKAKTQGELSEVTQTVKHHIDFEDLIASVLECKNCHATLSVRMGAEKVIIPKKCPSCEFPWYVEYMNQTSVGEKIRDLFEQFRQLRESLEATGSSKCGFTLQLELAPAVSSPASSSRDA